LYLGKILYIAEEAGKLKCSITVPAHLYPWVPLPPVPLSLWKAHVLVFLLLSLVTTFHFVEYLADFTVA
jgi:hypothetical protein